MVKVTFGEKAQRLKRNLYLFGILLLLLLVTCRVLSLVDWSSFQRSEFEKHLHEIETEVLLEQVPAEFKVRKFLGRCNMLLRNRWQTGYLYSEITREGYFVGRPSPPEFRKAVEAQKKQIDAGKKFEKSDIPKLRMIVELPRLKGRLLVADAPPLYEREY